MTAASQQGVLQQIKRIVLEQEPSAKVYLYGSRARGDARGKDSDWDILILLNKDKITLDEERKITYPLYDLEFDIGEVISLMVLSEKDWNYRHKVTPFYQNVMREGVLL